MGQLFDFGWAVKMLKAGRCIKRIGWDGRGMFVCKQVPSVIDSTIIPKMQSLPESAKNLVLADNQEPIRYNNQMIIVKISENKVVKDIDSWVPSASDVFAEDWCEVNV